jgi:hypothetical protein
MALRPRYKHRSRGQRAKCRFCSRTLPRPKKRENELALHPLLPGAKCPCGATYVVDPTGRNGGNALIDALIDLSGDRVNGPMLMRGHDYEEYIENYNTDAHQFITGFRGYRRGMARLYLVKLIDTSEESGEES